MGRWVVFQTVHDQVIEVVGLFVCWAQDSTQGKPFWVGEVVVDIRINAVNEVVDGGLCRHLKLLWYVDPGMPAVGLRCLGGFWKNTIPHIEKPFGVVAIGLALPLQGNTHILGEAELGEMVP